MEHPNHVHLDTRARVPCVLKFRATFSDGRTIQRSSAERLYTHAWLACFETGVEQSHMHGFSISRAHAETRLAEQRKLFSRPMSNVRMLRWEICEVDWERDELAPVKRRSIWR